jgi:hypothetical protein
MSVIEAKRNAYLKSMNERPGWLKMLKRGKKLKRLDG